MSFTEGALVEPLAIGRHACNTGGVKLGQTVMITGAGCIGLVTLLAAKAYGATQIIVGDVLDKRLAKAEELGAIPVNTKNEDIVAKIMELTNGRGADVCIDCAGFSTTVDACMSAAKPAGMVIIVGLGEDKVNGFNTSIMSTRELTVKSIFRYRNLYPTAINAIADGRINVGAIVSHRFKFDDTINAFATCHKDIRNVVKGVIEY
jgi:L-iditol 2-dehydrogenase